MMEQWWNDIEEKTKVHGGKTVLLLLCNKSYVDCPEIKLTPPRQTSSK
jgi:hypothetical protein